MRKSIIAAMLASLIFLAAFAPPALASPLHNSVFTLGQSTYVVDGLAKNMDGAPFLQDNRVLVPVRYLGYALGLTDSDITWDQANQMAILSMGNTTVVLTPKEKTYYVNGETKQMDTLPLLKNGRLYLPARYVAEAFGYSISWDQTTKSVIIGPAGNGSSGVSSSTSQTSASNEYNLQIVPVPSSAQTGQSIQLDISVTNDSNGAVSGVTVYLTSNSNTVQLSPAVLVTNSSGQGVVTATDSSAETVTITATVANSYTTANTTVQWSGTQSQSSSTSTHSNNYYLGLTSSQRSVTTGQPVAFTVTVVNNASNPVSGTGVSISANSTHVVLSAANLVTNAQGQAFFTATDSSPETVTLTVTPTVGGSPQTVNVSWSAPPSTPENSLYSTTPSLQISSTANTAAVGEPVVYTVTATGTKAADGSSAVVVTGNSVNAKISSTVLTINNAGQAFFTARDGLAEDVTFTVRMSGSASVMATAATQWLNSYVQPNSFLNNSPVYLLQMNVSSNEAAVGQPVVLEMTVLDNNNQPAGDIGIFLKSSSGNAQMGANFVTTNSQGKAYVTVSDSVAGNVTFTGSLANVTSRRPNVKADVDWSAQTQGSTAYSVINSPVAVSGYYATLGQSSDYLALGDPAVLAVTITNSDNQPVSGLSVLVSCSSSNVKLTETNSATNAQGQIFLTAVDTTAESVTLSIQIKVNGTYGVPVSAGTMEWY